MQENTTAKAAGARLLWAAAVATLSLGGAAAQAATTQGTFNVNVTLTPKCEIFTTGQTSTISDLALAYTSFQTSASTSSTNFKVRCTNTLGYGLSLDSASLTDGTTGLAVTLALSNSATPVTTAVASLTGLAGNGGTGQTYYVHGTIAADQVGTNTPGTPNTQRTLTITY